MANSNYRMHLRDIVLFASVGAALGGLVGYLVGLINGSQMADEEWSSFLVNCQTSTGRDGHAEFEVDLTENDPVKLKSITCGDKSILFVHE